MLLDSKWSKLLLFLINVNSVTKNIHVAMRYTKGVYLIFHNHVVPPEFLIKKTPFLSQQCFYSIPVQYLGFLFLTSVTIFNIVCMTLHLTPLVAYVFSCNDSQYALHQLHYNEILYDKSCLINTMCQYVLILPTRSGWDAADLLCSSLYGAVF